MNFKLTKYSNTHTNIIPLAPRDKEDVVTCSTSSIHHVVDMFFNEAGNAIQHNIAVYTRSIKHKLYFRQVIAVLIGLDWAEFYVPANTV